MSAFYWDDLLEELTVSRNVVPVIGHDLLSASSPERATFYRDLAARTAEKLTANGIKGVPADADFSAFLDRALARVRHRGEFTRALSAAHRELLAELPLQALPEPLRLLAEITDFPLVLTTSIDGLAASAFGVPESAALLSTLSENADLPAEWKPPPRGAPPTLVHLFGRIAATPGYALTEEDTLEFMWNLQGEKRPTRLLSRIRRNHVLLLGNCFSDWLARFFLRLLRGDRLSVESETFEALADPEARDERPLVTFLQNYSPQTRIYTEGTVADFVMDLHERWRAIRPQSPSSPSSDAASDAAEPGEMRAGAIFISYASEDHAEAATLALALDRAGLDVWFDKNELRGGDRYKAKISRYIKQCDLFVPLISRHTEARQSNEFFRFEWSEAKARLPFIGPARPFMMPLVIDETNAYASPDLGHYFQSEGREVHVLRVPGGVPDDRTVQDFIGAIRQVRSPRPSAVPVPAG